MPQSRPVPFSADQLELLMEWRALRPYHLGLVIAVDHVDQDEVAELGRDPRYADYTLFPRASGVLELSSRLDSQVLIMPDLDQSLARIGALEVALRYAPGHQFLFDFCLAPRSRSGLQRPGYAPGRS